MAYRKKRRGGFKKRGRRGGRKFKKRSGTRPVRIGYRM